MPWPGLMLLISCLRVPAAGGGVKACGLPVNAPSRPSAQSRPAAKRSTPHGRRPPRAVKVGVLEQLPGGGPLPRVEGDALADELLQLGALHLAHGGGRHALQGVPADSGAQPQHCWGSRTRASAQRPARKRPAPSAQRPAPGAAPRAHLRHALEDLRHAVALAVGVLQRGQLQQAHAEAVDVDALVVVLLVKHLGRHELGRACGHVGVWVVAGRRGRRWLAGRPAGATLQGLPLPAQGAASGACGVQRGRGPPEAARAGGRATHPRRSCRASGRWPAPGPRS
jgi:hypothetical protein